MTNHSQAPGGEGLPVVAWLHKLTTESYRESSITSFSETDPWVDALKDIGHAVISSPLVRLSDALTHAANLRAEVERLTRELAALKRETTLQALSDSGQEIEAMERVNSIMAMADEYAKSAEEYAYDTTGRTEKDRAIARTALRAALEAKPCRGS